MKGEWILVADNIDCGWTSQQHSAMANFSIKTMVVLRYVGLTLDKHMDMKQLKETLNEHTKLVSTFHISKTKGCCFNTCHLLIFTWKMCDKDHIN